MRNPQNPELAALRELEEREWKNGRRDGARDARAGKDKRYRPVNGEGLSPEDLRVAQKAYNFEYDKGYDEEFGKVKLQAFQDGEKDGAAAAAEGKHRRPVRWTHARGPFTPHQVRVLEETYEKGYRKGYSTEQTRLKEAAARPPAPWSGPLAKPRHLDHLLLRLKPLGWSWKDAAARLQKGYPNKIPSAELKQATEDEVRALIGLLNRDADGPTRE